jgi:hypothetical protein
MRRLLLLLLLASPAMAQVSVSLAPVVHMQFFDNNGKPLANGCINTYQAGTTTPAATYVDSTGTAQNTNPIILNAGGFADIWLPNAAFKFKVSAAAIGVTNCSSLGVTQYTIDGISGVFGLLNLANTFTAQNTFTQPIIITPNNNQIVLGAGGNQTTLNAPAPAGNITVNFPTTAGTLAEKSGDTFTSPIINTPVVNGVSVSGVPGTYVTFPNAGAPGTILNTLTVLAAGVSPATAIRASTVATLGVIGITVAGAGSSGTATIQQSGTVSCIFDGATTEMDYVQISPTVAGDCHDAGSVRPATGQLIGYVTTTNGVAGTYQIDLFGHEILPQTAASRIDLTAQAANIVSTPILTPTANGFYRISCYLVLTQAATVSSTIPVCNLLYTDGDTNTVESAQVLTAASSANTVGIYSNLGNLAGNTFNFFARSGASINYSTTGYASAGATPMQYALHIRIEGPF